MTTASTIKGRHYVSAAALAKLLAEPQRLPIKAARQAMRLAVGLRCTRWQD